MLLVLSATHWVRLYLDRDYQLLLDSSQSSAPASNGVGINVDELVSYHLFGTAPATAPSPSENIPLSSLNLKLTGVVASDRGGFALISVNGQPQTPFFIGEVVTQNAVLDSVLTDRVILLRGNLKESLLLDNEDQHDSIGTALSSPPSPPSRRAGIPDNAIQDIGTNKYLLPKKVVAANINNMDVLSQALIVPNKGGGFLVKSVEQNSVFEKLGLRKGDVIRKVNNMPVNSMVDVMQLYRLTNDMDRINNVRVELSRNGTTQTLQYNLK